MKTLAKTVLILMPFINVAIYLYLTHAELHTHTRMSFELENLSFPLAYNDQKNIIKYKSMEIYFAVIKTAKEKKKRYIRSFLNC